MPAPWPTRPTACAACLHGSSPDALRAGLVSNPHVVGSGSAAGRPVRRFCRTGPANTLVVDAGEHLAARPTSWPRIDLAGLRGAPWSDHCLLPLGRQRSADAVTSTPKARPPSLPGSRWKTAACPHADVVLLHASAARTGASESCRHPGTPPGAAGRSLDPRQRHPCLQRHEAGWPSVPSLIRFTACCWPCPPASFGWPGGSPNARSAPAPMDLPRTRCCAAPPWWTPACLAHRTGGARRAPPMSSDQLLISRRRDAA